VCMKVPWEAGLLYDAVLMWALIADSMLKNSQDITNGSLFLSRTSNFTFFGAESSFKNYTIYFMSYGTVCYSRYR
jgi:hypothetical protein